MRASPATARTAPTSTSAQLHSHAVQQALLAQTLSGRTDARATVATQVCVLCLSIQSIAEYRSANGTHSLFHSVFF